MNIKRLGKKCACLLLSSSLLVGGSCIPNNFWIDTWDTVLTTSVVKVSSTVVDIWIVDPLLDAVGGGDDAE